MFPEILLDFWKFFNKEKLPEKPKSPKFPLLKLPRVVLLECIENLDVLEIIQFSLLSKQTKSIAKLICWSPLDIRFLCGVDGSISICLGTTDPGLRWIVTYSNDGKSSEFPYFQSNLHGPRVDHFLVLGDNENAIKGSIQIAEHICEVFRSPVCFIQLADQSLVDWIMNFQPTIQYACIRNDVVTSVESLNCIFKSLKVTEHFVLQPLEKDKKINVTEPIPYRSISIMDSYWVTLPSILNGNNSIICLYDSKFTPKDINTILKEWQKGSKLQNLEFLEIQAPTLLDAARYSNEILEDLNLLEHEENDGRPRTVNIHSEYIYTLPEAVPVHSLMRSDGMILSIIGQHVIFEDGKTTIILDMQVWRKQA